MKVIEINTPLGISKVIIGESLRKLPKYLSNRKGIIITDDNILRYYRDELPDYPMISIGRGEKYKTLATLEQIFDSDAIK